MNLFCLFSLVQGFVNVFQSKTRNDKNEESFFLKENLMTIENFHFVFTTTNLNFGKFRYFCSRKPLLLEEEAWRVELLSIKLIA